MKILRKIFSEDIAFIFSSPALLWEIVFLYLPILVLVGYSFSCYSAETGSWVFSFYYYKQVLNSLYLRVIFNSTRLALFASLICLVIAYPVAYFLAIKVTKRFRTFLLFSLILPSWTSLVVQIYAWFFLLEKDGLVSRVLHWIGIIPKSMHLLNNYFSVMVGLVSCFLPFMILPIYVVLDKMDPLLLEASADLGANRLETFKRVIFPLSLPGVYTGFLLVFVPVFGEFAIPTLLGGSTFVVWGSLIVDKFLRARDWPFGSALAIVGILLFVIMIIGCIILGRLLRNLKNVS
jgi:spermidine/putrescine transport system permease protein